MTFSVFRSIVLAAMLMMGLSAFAQTSSAKAKEGEVEKGFSEIESFQATINSDQRLFKLDSTVGWDFNKHFGVFGGVPVYFIQSPSFTTTTGTTTTTTPSSSNKGIGNAYLGLAFRVPNPALDYGSTITVGAPTGDTKKGLSSGRATIDFDNRF